MNSNRSGFSKEPPLIHTVHFLLVSHAEWKACLIRNHLFSLTVIWVACAQEGSGIQCVVRMGSPTCPRAWLAASPPLVLAEIQ